MTLAISGLTRSAPLLLAAIAGACSPSASFTQVTDASAGAYETSLAATGDGFVAAWYDTRDGLAKIYARRLDADGKAIGPERRLTAGNANAYEADIAPLPEGFVVGWYEKESDGRAVANVGAWSMDGSARWTKTVSPRGRNTVVRTAAGLVFIAWIENEVDDGAGVWATWRRADGLELIPPRRIADAGRTTWNLNAAIDSDASPGHPHAWLVFDAKAGTKNNELFLVETGETRDRVAQLTSDDGAASKYPDIALTRDRMAITWFDAKDGNDEVYLLVGGRDAFGQGRSPSAIRITSTPGHSTGAYLAWNGDRLGLAWCDDTPGNQEVYFQSFDRDGRSQAEPTRITKTAASSSIPAIKASGRGFALLWNEHEPGTGDGHGGGGRSQVVFTMRR